MLPTGAGEPRTLKLPDGFDRFQGAQWLPDGRMLVEALERGHDPKVYVLESSGKLRAISEEGLLSPPVVSPDGRHALVFVTSKTMLLDIGGGPARPVPGVEPAEWPVAWSADGESALVSADRNLAMTVTKVNLKNGARTPWKVLTAADPAGLVSMSYLHFSADWKSYAYTYARQLGELYVVDGLH